MADSPIGAGTVLAGRFKLEDLLDETDGARFWRATDQTLARNVAVHVLTADDPRSDSLLTAARTSALVTDAHLLRVLDAAAEDGVVYVVNEWGSGISLDRLLSEGPLSPRRAAWVVKEVAEAIATAHRNGVAHGRLLPETVMINEAGSVKLVGFVVDAVLRGREQRRVTGGEPISAHEADVINLAALLYAALVGRWPGTEGSSIPDAPAEHGRPLRPRQVRAGVPRPLDAVCDRVLNAEGHQSAMPILTAHEIYAALSDYIGDPAGSPQVGYEPTTVLQTGPTGESARGEADDGDGPATQLSPAAQPGGSSGTETGELPPTGALPAVATNPSEDAPDSPGDDADSERTGELDSTQAGAPVFFDEDTGVGWMSSTDSRGLRQEETDEAPRARRSPPPPPPDLPPHPERPLFAEGPSAAAAAAAASAARQEESGSFVGGFTGTGASVATGHRRRAQQGWDDDDSGTGWRTDGGVPATWGPDADRPDQDDDDYDGYDDPDNGRNWLKLAAAIAGVVVLVVAIIFAFNLGRGPSSNSDAQSGPSSSSPSASKQASAPVRIAGVTDFDPEGDPPEENPELTPLAIDGKPGTAWQTLTYRGNPKLGGLKNGVGLLVDLGKKTEVNEVRLTLLGQGTSLEILAAPDAVAAPSDTDGLDTVASATNAGSRVALPFDKPVTTQWLVVWLTSLPPAPGGFKGQVAEISVRS